MDTGSEEGQPHDDRQRCVDGAASAAQIAGEVDAGQTHCRHEEGKRVEVLGVDERDDAERPDVIDDGEREEEDAEPAGNARSDEGESSYEERRVRRYDDSPRVLMTRSGRDDHEQERRDGKTGHGRDHRHHCAGPARELADGELAPHLEPDGEEEDRHQGVVHQRVQGEVELEIRDSHGQVGVPELRVRQNGHIRPDDGDDGRDQQEKRADAVLPYVADPIGDRSTASRACPRVHQLGVRRRLDDRQVGHSSDSSTTGRRAGRDAPTADTGLRPYEAITVQTTEASTPALSAPTVDHTMRRAVSRCGDERCPGPKPAASTTLTNSSNLSVRCCGLIEDWGGGRHGGGGAGGAGGR